MAHSPKLVLDRRRFLLGGAGALGASLGCQGDDQEGNSSAQPSTATGTEPGAGGAPGQGSGGAPGTGGTAPGTGGTGGGEGGASPADIAEHPAFDSLRLAFAGTPDQASIDCAAQLDANFPGWAEHLAQIEWATATPETLRDNSFLLIVSEAAYFLSLHPEHQLPDSQLAFRDGGASDCVSHEAATDSVIKAVASLASAVLSVPYIILTGGPIGASAALGFCHYIEQAFDTAMDNIFLQEDCCARNEWEGSVDDCVSGPGPGTGSGAAANGL